jgi:hypothetical protein
MLPATINKNWLQRPTHLRLRRKRMPVDLDELRLSPQQNLGRNAATLRDDTVLFYSPAAGIRGTCGGEGSVRAPMFVVALMLAAGTLAIEPRHAEQLNVGQLLEAYDHDGMEEETRRLFEIFSCANLRRIWICQCRTNGPKDVASLLLAAPTGLNCSATYRSSRQENYRGAAISPSVIQFSARVCAARFAAACFSLSTDDAWSY